MDITTICSSIPLWYSKKADTREGICFFGAAVLLRYPVCALPTARLRCTPTAATRSAPSSRPRRQSHRSPESHLRFDSVVAKNNPIAPRGAMGLLVPLSCCGARCAPCRRCGCVAHRPLPLALLLPPAPGGSRIAPRNLTSGSIPFQHRIIPQPHLGLWDDWCR